MYNTFEHFIKLMTIMRLAGCFYCCWAKWEKKRMSSKIWIPNSSATKMTWKILWEPWRWWLSSVVTGLSLLEIKCRISSCYWLNYNASWTASIGGCLLLSDCVNWEGMGILKVGTGCRRGTWWSWKHWAYKFWCLFASESNVPIPPVEVAFPWLLRELSLPCLRKIYIMPFPEEVDI